MMCFALYSIVGAAGSRGRGGDSGLHWGILLCRCPATLRRDVFAFDLNAACFS